MDAAVLCRTVALAVHGREQRAAGLGEVAPGLRDHAHLAGEGAGTAAGLGKGGIRLLARRVR